MKIKREIYATIFIRKWGSFIIIKDKKDQKHRKPMKLTLFRWYFKVHRNPHIVSSSFSTAYKLRPSSYASFG